MEIAKQIPCLVIGIDTDEIALEYLEEKARKETPKGVIETKTSPVYEIDYPDEYFDVIIAEGIFNIIGFEKGFRHVIPFLKKEGYFIIHDEFSDWEKKINLIEKFNCKIIEEIVLSQDIWEERYINKLREALKNLLKEEKSPEKEKVIQTLKDETGYFDKHPEMFQSRCYVIRKLIY